MPSIPFSSAPRIGSSNLMTGRLIPVNSPESNFSQPIQRSDIDLVGVGSRKLTGSDFLKPQSDELSASDLQNDPKRSWVNLWSPKQVIPTTPKTMDNPPPEPPIPHKSLNVPASSTNDLENLKNGGYWTSLNNKFNDFTRNLSNSVELMTPIEKGVVFGGVPLALLGAYYVHKKMKQKNK